MNGIIDKLKLEKNSLNTKRLGEQLEKWCVQEYNNYAIAGFQNCEFIKMNDSIKENDDNKATKPDFKFGSESILCEKTGLFGNEPFQSAFSWSASSQVLRLT